MDKKNWVLLVIAAATSGQAFGAAVPAKKPMKVSVQKTNVARAKKAEAKKHAAISSRGFHAVPISSSVAATPVAPVSATAKKPGADSVPMKQSSALSTSRVKSPERSVLDDRPGRARGREKSDFIVGLNNYYSGSAMVEPFAGYQPDPASGYDMAATELTHVVLGYRLNKTWSVSLNPFFSTSPNYREYDSDSGTYNAKYGSTMKPVASFLRLASSEFAKSDVVKWSGDFRYCYAPLTNDMRGETDPASGKKLGLFHTFRTGQNVAFKLSDKTSFTVYNILRVYGRPNGYQPDGGKPALPLAKVESMPTLSYQAFEKVGFSLAYDMVATYQYGRSIFSLDNAGTYLQPGLTWDITDKISFFPYLNVQTSKSVSENTTQWGFELYWSIL